MPGLTLELEIGSRVVVTVPSWEYQGSDAEGEASYSRLEEEIEIVASRERTGRMVLTIVAPKRFPIRREKTQ